jgi:hypothetical protein
MAFYARANVSEETTSRLIRRHDHRYARLFVPDFYRENTRRLRVKYPPEMPMESALLAHRTLDLGLDSGTLLAPQQAKPCGL